ncbi:MAG TPA: TadE/TadG family type IV pilus assembly protein [Devosia sp.]|nr:TadE/TadG family type IV pilus assembly protein [Devosia sp.]
MRHRLDWIGDVRGASAVEFAILTPLFLLMLTGMLAYGIYFGAAHSLQELAADAARASIAGLNQIERNRLVQQFLDGHAESYLLIARNRLTFSIGDKPADLAQYHVTLRYDVTQLPIWNLYPPLPLPNRFIVTTSTVRRDGPPMIPPSSGPTTP